MSQAELPMAQAIKVMQNQAKLIEGLEAECDRLREALKEIDNIMPTESVRHVGIESLVECVRQIHEIARAALRGEGVK